MKLMLIAYALSLMFVLLMVVRVWRASVLDGVLTLLVPFYFIVAMIKYWNEPDHTIRFHVLGLVICSGIAYYAATNVARDVIVGTPEQRTAMVKAFRDEGVALTAEQEKGLLSDDPDVVMATLQSLDMESTDSDGNADGAVATRPRDAEFENPAPVPVQERPAEVLSYAEAARRAVFNRGRYTREAIGITIDVPAKFRLISATDARRLDQARGRSDDTRGLGWIIHENLALTDPDAWHVGVRWHSDGWVAAAALDPVGLLDSALANKAPAPRVAVSHSDLLGYAVAPQFDGQVIDWAEERVLVNSDEQVVDCHALRLGRRGVVEFSITGMSPKSTSLCHATVRLLATRASFAPGKQYEATAPAEGLRAPYTVATLATHAF
ncbi:DUF2167 domain-containing protein [Tahibacter sp.]|uniref:DUF2167 domain-containing protein n=1 Tax=Tahibacter sp. TaxID=2056211 RepID=UPI0028C418BC|nr:DUF2167 domain-containing protein [Tahibacter sp.]